MLLRLILKPIMQLNQIKDKGHYKVLKMDESQRCISRLMDMGLLPGELIRIRHEAPLGDQRSAQICYGDITETACSAPTREHDGDKRDCCVAFIIAAIDTHRLCKPG